MRKIVYSVAYMFMCSGFMMASNTSLAQDALSPKDEGSVKNSDDKKSASDPNKNTDSASDNKNRSSKSDKNASNRDNDISVGGVRTSIGVSQPKFGGALKYYKSLYGTASQEYDLSANYYIWKKPSMALGVGIGTGFYRDLGYAANTRTPKDGGVLQSSEIDKTSKVELTLVPLTFSLSMVITPLPFWRWLQLSLEAGPDALYVQEVRLTNAYSSTTSGGTEYLNTGWNEGGFVGASLNFNIDALDRMSVNSMAVLGLRSVYLSPYFSMHKTSKYQTSPFDRTSVGLMFTFESLN